MTIQNHWQPLTVRQPPITESASEADPWASYQDELDLQSSPAPADTRAPQAPVNDFTAAAARLLQRQKSMAEAAKKAQEEAKAKAAKSDK